MGEWSGEGSAVLKRERGDSPACCRARWSTWLRIGRGGRWWQREATGRRGGSDRGKRRGPSSKQGCSSARCSRRAGATARGQACVARAGRAALRWSKEGGDGEFQGCRRQTARRTTFAGDAFTRRQAG